jgi:LDH2 family malate/lactate/ureidoglycolate dehydrogenase
LDDDDARAVADVLVDANLRGIDSHGLARVPAYLRRVHAGLAGGTARMASSGGPGPLQRVDAAGALGPAAATRAIDLAIELARRHGVGVVAVRNSTHFGAAGYYARRAAQRRLIGIVATNGPAVMAPHGSVEGFLGTNAVAIGAPLGRPGEFVLDMSCSVTARGRIMRAERLGRPIPQGLAIDGDGRPTTDPSAALAGAVLPLGGAKGSGLAFAVALLAGVLGGAAFDDEVVPMHGVQRPQNVGHVFMTLDPWHVADPAEALARVEALVERLHTLKPAEGVDRVRFAGERGDEEAAVRRRHGVPLAVAELLAVARACEECGLVAQAAHARALASA